MRQTPHTALRQKTTNWGHHAQGTHTCQTDKGNILKGYQQRGCQSYYLPLDNGGYPFEWTSNLQAICPVELNPLPNKNRTYKLQPNSKKMVTEGMKKHTQ